MLHEFLDLRSIKQQYNKTFRTSGFSLMEPEGFIVCYFTQSGSILPHPLAFIQPHLIGDHGDELRVGRLPA